MMLREEIRIVRGERRMAYLALLIFLGLAVWHQGPERLFGEGALLILGLGLLSAILEQLYSIRIDAYFREIRDLSPDLELSPPSSHDISHHPGPHPRDVPGS